MAIVFSTVRHIRRRTRRKGTVTTTMSMMSSRNQDEHSCNNNVNNNNDDKSSWSMNRGGGTHRGYSLFRHYPFMCTLALSLVVLCTSEAFLSSTTPFLPPRGGATRSSSSSTTTNTVNTCDGAILTTATTTHRNLYMEDGHGGGGDETGGCNNNDINGDYYNLGVSSSSSSTTPVVNGKSQPFVKKNGTKVLPNQIRLTNGSVAAATATRMPPPVSIRNNNNNNGFGNPRSVNGLAAAVSATVVGPMGMANGVVIHKTGLPFGNNRVVGNEVELVDQPVPAEFVAETDLPTDVGQFRLRAYRTDPDPVNEFTGREPTVIYATDKSPFGKDNQQLQENVPIRIHDQCLTSEVFRSQR